MYTVENSIIIPVFTVMICMLIIFNLELHKAVVTRSDDARTKRQQEWNDEKWQPQNTLRAVAALKKIQAD